MKSSILVLAIVVCITMGCTGKAGPIIWNFGQSSITTCGAVTEGETVPDCITINGAAVSEQGSSLIGGVLAGALRMLGLSYGVPTVPAPEE